MLFEQINNTSDAVLYLYYSDTTPNAHTDTVLIYLCHLSPW